MLRPPTRSPLLAVCALAALATAAAGCGGSGSGGADANRQPAPPSPQVAAAGHPRAADFPAPAGRTLQQLADTLAPGPQAAPATSVYTPGTNRLAFGLLDAQGRFLYGPSAVYVARSPRAPAGGPFLAPADSLQVRPPFRSQTSANDPADVKAVYAAQVPLPRAGRWYVLVVTRAAGGAGGKPLGASTTIEVAHSSPIPAVGQAPPRIDTPTLASAGGNVKAIDTRVPPDDMHKVSLRAVLGRKPVALLFATPALCQSRVCGPVVDVAAQLETVFGSRVAFIHNEVYIDNNASKGLRPQLKAFHLQTEPWLFAIDRRGRIVARLEGAFGIDEMRAAIERAQRG
jgi:hypothetical protein